MNMRIKEGFPKQRLAVIPLNVIERSKSLPLAKQLYVTDIGAYPSAPYHYVSRPEGVDQAILICCLSGSGRLKIEGQEHSIGRGGVFIIPPKTPHTYWSVESDPWSVLWVHFDGLRVNEVIETFAVERKNPLLFVPDIARVKAAFENVIACLNYHYSDAGLLAMSSELIRLCSVIKLGLGHLEPKRQSTENHVMGTIDFMHQHLHMLLTLKELANHAGQSQSHYSRVFKEKTGQSPLNYFIQLKISKACELLSDTEMKVSEIALELGYADPYYFSRLFRKLQGVAPALYRASLGPRL